MSKELYFCSVECEQIAYISQILYTLDVSKHVCEE